MAREEGTARPLKLEEYQHVIKTLPSVSSDPLRDIAIISVSYRVGLRAMEICGLTLKDIIDPVGNLRTRVTLRKKTTKGMKGGVAFFEHEEVLSHLHDYIVQKRSTITTEYDNLFISRKSTPFHPGSMSRLISTLYKKCGLVDGYQSHSGRKGLAKLLNENNYNVFNIQKALRHSNVETTIKHYISVDEDVLANMMKSV